MDASPFHVGEQEAQARAGVRLKGAPIRDWMTDQHRLFFAGLPFLLAATVDGEGCPMATVLAGPPGFVSSPDPRTLRIAIPPDVGDPAAARLRAGSPVGLLGIDLGTRRRNRANGIVLAADESGLTIGVRQSFGNCPQYIQARDAVPAPGSAQVADVAAERLGSLDEEARDLVASADTFFVATSSGGRGGEADGVDVSHRGGRPGFVRLEGDVLTIPDFRGNRYFNTLGNLLLDPRAALLFLDFATGSLLHLQGRAEILWDGEEVHGLAGAERLWRVRVDAAWRRRGGLPLRWAFHGYAPTTERTGIWAPREAKPEPRIPVGTKRQVLSPNHSSSISSSATPAIATLSAVAVGVEAEHGPESRPPCRRDVDGA